MFDRRDLLAAGLAGSALAGGGVLAKPAGASKELKLWPSGAPGLANVQVTLKSVEDHERGVSVGRSISGVTEPLVSIHKAQGGDTAILAIAGGGFRGVMYDKEGEMICAWLNANGISAGSLLYRLPNDGWPDKQNAPVADAKRALRLLARETGAKRLGVLGFSAGGTIAAALTTRWDEEFYAPIDEADRIDARPSFMGLGYPYLNRPTPPGGAASMYRGMTRQSPPAFFFLAADDKTVRIENSTAAYQELCDLKVPAALHIFESGDHGFALGAPKGSSAARWPELFLTWARDNGFVGAKT